MLYGHPVQDAIPCHIRAHYPATGTTTNYELTGKQPEERKSWKSPTTEVLNHQHNSRLVTLFVCRTLTQNGGIDMAK